MFDDNGVVKEAKGDPIYPRQVDHAGRGGARPHQGTRRADRGTEGEGGLRDDRRRSTAAATILPRPRMRDGQSVADAMLDRVKDQGVTDRLPERRRHARLDRPGRRHHGRGADGAAVPEHAGDVPAFRQGHRGVAGRRRQRDRGRQGRVPAGGRPEIFLRQVGRAQCGPHQVGRGDGRTAPGRRSTRPRSTPSPPTTSCAGAATATSSSPTTPRTPTTTARAWSRWSPTIWPRTGPTRRSSTAASPRSPQPQPRQRRAGSRRLAEAGRPATRGRAPARRRRLPGTHVIANRRRHAPIRRPCVAADSSSGDGAKGPTADLAERIHDFRGHAERLSGSAQRLTISDARQAQVRDVLRSASAPPGSPLRAGLSPCGGRLRPDACIENTAPHRYVSRPRCVEKNRMDVKNETGATRAKAVGPLPSGHPPVKPAKIGVLLVNLGTPDGTDFKSDVALSARIPVGPARHRAAAPDLVSDPLRHRPERRGRRNPAPTTPRSGTASATNCRLRTFTRGQGEKLAARLADLPRRASSNGACATATRRPADVVDRLIAAGLRPHPHRSRSIRNIRRRRRRPPTTSCSAR